EKRSVEGACSKDAAAAAAPPKMAATWDAAASARAGHRTRNHGTSRALHAALAGALAMVGGDPRTSMLGAACSGGAQPHAATAVAAGAKQDAAVARTRGRVASKAPAG